MSELTIVAKFKAKNGAGEKLFQELIQLVEPSRRDAGCINYDLHRSTEDANLFLFYENWDSKELWEKHMETEHLRIFKERSKDLIESNELWQFEKVG